MPTHLLSAALRTGSVSDADAETPMPLSRYHLETMIIYAPTNADHIGLKLAMDGTHVTSSVMLLLPTSCGTISLASTSATDPPAISPNYFATATYHAALIYGTRRVMKTMLATAAGKEIIASEVAPPGMRELNLQSEDKDIDERIRGARVSHAHALGIAAMRKVMDRDLRVYGVEGLRVVDASVFPVPIGGHPQTSTNKLALVNE